MNYMDRIAELEERIGKLEKLVAYLVGGRLDDKMREQMGAPRCPF
jgi:hypothetical protein